MATNILKNVYDILNKNNLPPETVEAVSRDLKIILDNEIYQSTKQDKSSNSEYDILERKLALLWGESYESNYLLVQRALEWLHLSNTSEEIAAEDELEAISKLLYLGKILSEDLILSNGEFNATVLTKQQALEERNKLTQDKDFMLLLNNKTLMGHKETLEKLNKLNSIIANN